MVKFYGEFAKIQELENRISELYKLMSETYDFWDSASVPESLIIRLDSLERELATLKHDRSRGGLVCTCM